MKRLPYRPELAQRMAGMTEGEPLVFTCRDGVVLYGQVWRPHHPVATVIVTAATGVLARYYRFYAQFLSGQGFTVVTFDYRGIGASRSGPLRGSRIHWWDWGELDLDAVLAWAVAHGNGPVSLVGHSIGGFLPGFAGRAVHLERILTVGAQHAFWPDYVRRRRAQLFLKWHIAMPLLTAAYGYFPGKRLGWLEDLPKGVADTWSFGGRRFERTYAVAERQAVLDRFAAVTAPILAIGLTDDDFGTRSALGRALRPYANSCRTQIMLDPADLGMPEIGHFGAFHSRFQDRLWPAMTAWLHDGTLVPPLGKPL